MKTGKMILYMTAIVDSGTKVDAPTAMGKQNGRLGKKQGRTGRFSGSLGSEKDCSFAGYELPGLVDEQSQREGGDLAAIGHIAPGKTVVGAVVCLILPGTDQEQ